MSGGGRALRWDAARAGARIAVPAADSDKYRRGVLGLRTGSTAYPGAAVLGVEAAWRTGVGLVRYTPPLGDEPPAFGLPTPAAAVLAARPETVFADDSGASRSRCDAWLLGSGTDPERRSFAEREALRALLAGDAPAVVDAGALSEVLAPGRRAPVVVTPHRGEFLALWREAGLGDRPVGWPSDRAAAPGEDALAEAALALAGHLGTTVLLKGSVTVAATPAGFCAAAGPATPQLATAGTGDVLAGALGALVATHAAAVRDDPELLGPLAASAAALHDRAARIAQQDGAGGARDRRSDAAARPITALDVARALPAAVAAAFAEAS